MANKVGNKRVKVETEGRRREQLVCCPVIYGSLAFWMGRKADEHATHQWTLYVRGPHGEDLSYFLSKVEFHLHQSFPQPVRTLTEPPYEVTEKGWGEFEALIKLFFRDEDEAPIEMKHPIKLYPPGNQQLDMKTPVVHEFYDEVVFTEPREEFFQHMLLHQHDEAPEHPLQHHFPVYSDVDDIERITEAREILRQQTLGLKERITRLDGEIEAYRNQLNTVAAKASASASSSAASAAAAAST